MARWLTAWLRDRSFCVQFEGHTSKRFALGTRGVPQGSPLSPILWTLYLDSFFQDAEVRSMENVLVQGGYVDDLFVLAHDTTPERATLRVQAWLDRLYGWCERRGLTLDKPSFMVDDADSRVLWRIADTPMAAQGVGGQAGDRPRIQHPVAGTTREPPLIRLMDGTRQRPQPYIRILGVMIDSRMSTAAHVERASTNIVSMVKALHRTIGAGGGLTMRIRARIVQAVCQSTLDYACPALLPLNGRTRKALEVADQAMFRLIFGAPTTSRMPATTAMAQELGWLTSEDRWWKLGMRHVSKLLGSLSPLGDVMRQRACLEQMERHSLAGRPRTAVETSLLHATDIDTPFSLANRRGKPVGGKGRGSLVNVGPWRYALDAQLDPVEATGIPPIPPWDWSPMQVVIASTETAKKTALTLGNRLPAATALIFTDGSRKAAQPGQAGTGAAAYGRSSHPVGVWTYRQPLPSTHMDIFDAELFAIQIALQSCVEICRGDDGDLTGLELRRERRGRNAGTRWRRVEIFSDSQAALRRLQAGWKRDRGAGQGLCALVKRTWDELLQCCPGVVVTLRWVPAHCGIPGNEAADRAANLAAEGPMPTQGIAYSQSKARQLIEARTVGRSFQKWMQGSEGHRIVNPIHRTRPTSIYTGLKRKTTKVLLSWRCNIVLPSDEIDDQRLGTATCPCGHHVRDRDHLLLHCPLLEQKRQAVRRFFTPNERSSLEHLLQGGEFKGSDANKGNYLTAPEEWILAAWRLRFPPQARLADRPRPNLPPRDHPQRARPYVARMRSATPDLDISHSEGERWEDSPDEWQDDASEDDQDDASEDDEWDEPARAETPSDASSGQRHRRARRRQARDQREEEMLRDEATRRLPRRAADPFDNADSESDTNDTDFDEF